MYFPFLRGKQFELIALREIAGSISQTNKISPIIEPVKKKTSTYESTIKTLLDLKINFTLIVNPIVGDLKGDMNYICSNLIPKIGNSNFQLGIYINSKSDFKKIKEKLVLLGVDAFPLVLIITSIRESLIQDLEEFIGLHDVRFILTGAEIRNRRTILRAIRKVSKSLVSLSDPYNKQVRNRDYAEEEDEFFSEEHLYFSEEGFIGYSDLLTIGQDYSDKGYSPYAVAIHLTYFAEDNVFRIHHFVSDSNDDTSDVAGKFSEALDKLIPFINEKEITTGAAKEFRRLNEEGKYPGLGSVKKLSVLNHIELVNSYFVG